MGKYLSIALGGAVTFAGLWLLGAWRSDVLLVLKGVLPIMLFFSGTIALIAGISEVKGATAEKKK